MRFTNHKTDDIVHRLHAFEKKFMIKRYSIILFVLETLIESQIFSYRQFKQS